ncbi:MAG: agmatinase [Anaerolineae bacterium]
MTYAFRPPENFLGLPPQDSGFDDAEVVILPIPYEGTVSYGRGTSLGPAAILRASTQVELYDREFGGEPVFDYGVHTLPFLAPDLSGPEATVNIITEAVAELAATGKLVVGLGGEHTVSVGFGRGLHQALGNFTLVQIDAHADLRDDYEGTAYSHACVARRLADIAPIVQLGIRSISQEEADFIAANPDRVTVFYADDMHTDPGYLARLAEAVRGQRIYLTLDVDGLDPAIIPATGTPEPDGLTWRQVLDIVRVIVGEGHVIGFDVVELAPSPALHNSEFITAKLVYKILNLIMAARRERRG